MSAVRNLVAEIVDYAGLFPPASLSLPAVVGNFASYLQSEQAWMLGRLILPVDKLDEFQQQQPFLESTKKWRISALVPAGDRFSGGLQAIAEFNSRHDVTGDAGARIDAIEVKASSADEINQIIGQVPKSINAFLEIPHEQDSGKLIERIAAADENILAKIRTGGITGDLIPSPSQVARFISQCAQYKAGFKATAGLHHPLRGQYRLTYDNNPECGTMFGFLNVFIAACFAFSQPVSVQLLEAVLSETDVAAYAINGSGISWREMSVSADQIAEIRKRFAISFGSCSFDEPTTELAELGWL